MAEKKSRGRTKGFTMSNEHRLKIQKSNILSYLIKHAEGQRDMSQTQVTAAIALLKKTLPDLQTTTLEGGEKPVETKVQIGWEK